MGGSRTRRKVLADWHQEPMSRHVVSAARQSVYDLPVEVK